jgi:uncharacterized protein (DUF3820 family)
MTDQAITAPAPGPCLPFGKYKHRPLTEVPDGYLLWALAECKLSSGLRAALAGELESRGLAPPAAPPPRPVPGCPRCPGAGFRCEWFQDSISRWHIKLSCACCGRSLGFAPRVPPYLSLAGPPPATVPSRPEGVTA